MRDGTDEDKLEHLMDVLGDFLESRVRELMTGRSWLQEETPACPCDLEELAGPATEFGTPPPSPRIPDAPITQEEVDSFVRMELKLIDNGEYFKAVFE